MKFIYIALLSAFSVTGSIYDFNISSSDGSAIDFDAFRNKKILLVNIATQSEYAGQLTELQQLQTQYEDSLVVIGFPSNSFGHEPGSNEAIKFACHTQYGVNFLLAAKGDVRGSAIQPVYAWLTRESENGVVSSEVKGDFQKYLLDSHGQLLGIFKGSVSPLDVQIVSNITGSSN